MAHVSSREFVEWMAFDEFEPIGTRTVPDLMAVLVSLLGNVYRKEGTRPWLPQDVFSDPLLPRRLAPQEEAQRTAAVMGDYRRLRAERLAAAEAARIAAGGASPPES